ncbi:hypothetical protein UO65_4618 [Actinokineospora spheciospongiae]|uniref:PE domain-containing protein n=1 Tax=Actinokineospora spheciospongiae TaxID=909613 RepID=W7ITH8_9PSEU|nr:hypothetical protein [Actinokineospora spheciospongiae]EWC60052.1 hypothetical protein UO65_4618 [Actinokineospora spheciospongiae]
MDNMNAASMQAIGASMNAFAGAAAAGQFAVNEHGGKAILDAIKKMADWIEGQEFDLAQLEQEPLLGSSNAAQVMKPFMVQVATDANGFITQLMAFKDTLRQADQAIRLAMENYREVDQEVASAFTVAGE